MSLTKLNSSKLPLENLSITADKLHTNLDLSSKNITLASDQISGDAVHDGTISGTQASQWDTAYSWGDHAAASYMPTTGGTFTSNVSVGGTGSGLVTLNGASSGVEGGQLDIECSSSLGTYSIDAYSDDLRFLNGTTSGNYLWYKNNNASIGMTLYGTGALHVGGDIQRAGTNTRIHGNGMVLEGGSPTITYRDTGQNVAFHHCNSNLLYVLRGATNTESWTAVNGQWPAIHNLTNNDFSVGRNITAVGNITAYSSDERLKENIAPIPDALSKVMQIKGCTFDWKDIVDDLGFTPDTRKDDVGLIAQDVEAVLPTLVVHAPFDRKTPEPNSEEDQSQVYLESKSGEFYKTIQYEKVCALLVEAIKEQQQQIEELKEIVNGSSV